MNAAERLSESIVCTAIEWQMRLRAQAGNAELQRQWQEWLSRDARHQLAWQRVQQMNGMFQGGQLPNATRSIAVLQRAQTDLSRRRTLKLLGLGLTVGAGGLLATQAPPAWRADAATATGERRQLRLGDDVRVTLNTDSAVDLQDRQLILRSGEALIDGQDWRARCRFATCSATDASALLRERDERSEIRVQRGQLRVVTPSGERLLQAGEGLSVSAAGAAALGSGALDPFAWTRGLLVVRDIRLGDFIAEAGRYRQGWLRCDATVADLRLSGVFRLDRPEDMLHNITHLLPVKVVERTSWWVTVMPAV